VGVPSYLRISNQIDPAFFRKIGLQRNFLSPTEKILSPAVEGKSAENSLSVAINPNGSSTDALFHAWPAFNCASLSFLHTMDDAIAAAAPHSTFDVNHLPLICPGVGCH
jgi:hypothetical protein